MGEERARAKGSSLNTEAQWMTSFIGALAEIIDARVAYSASFQSRMPRRYQDADPKVHCDHPLPRGLSRSDLYCSFSQRLHFALTQPP